MTEEHKQKIRQTHLRLAHGDGWTEEDQKEFERERNNRQCRKYRKKHKEEFRDYQKIFQKGFRERNPYYYAYKQYSKRHKGITYEEYVEYRKQKEAKKEQYK